MACEYYALVIVQQTQVIGTEMLQQPGNYIFSGFLPVCSSHVHDILSRGPLEIAGVFDGLPVGVGSGIVALEFYDYQFAIGVDSKQVKPLIGAVEAAKLLDDY